MAVHGFERLEVDPPRVRAPARAARAGRRGREALETEEHLLAQAGTGTGKSLGYLIPALASGRRAVVSTATKALQDQLLTKDVPLAAEALGRRVRVAVLKGRQNYLCRKRVDAAQLNGVGLLAGHDGAFERLLPWISTTATGDRAELDEGAACGAVVGAGRRPRPLSRPPLPTRADLLRRVGSPAGGPR